MRSSARRGQSPPGARSLAALVGTLVVALCLIAPGGRAHAAEPPAAGATLLRPADAGTATTKPATGRPDSSVAVAGLGWIPDSKGYRCELLWMTVTGPQVGDCTVADDGSLTGQFVVPANAQPGAAVVEVCNAGDDASCAAEPLDARAVPFTVEQPPVRSRPSAAALPTLKPLSDKGSSASLPVIGLAVGGALLLLLAVLAGRVIARRRHHPAAQPERIAVRIQPDPPHVTCAPTGGRGSVRFRLLIAPGHTTVTTTTGDRP